MGFGAAMARGADGLAPMTFTGDKLAGQAQEAAGSVSLPGPEQPAALPPGAAPNRICRFSSDDRAAGSLTS